METPQSVLNLDFEGHTVRGVKTSHIPLVVASDVRATLGIEGDRDAQARFQTDSFMPLTLTLYDVLALADNLAAEDHSMAKKALRLAKQIASVLGNNDRTFNTLYDAVAITLEVRVFRSF